MYGFCKCKCDLQWETDSVPSESLTVALDLLEDQLFLKGQAHMKNKGEGFIGE